MRAVFVALQGREIRDGLSAAQAVTTAEAAASCQEGAWRCEGQSVYDSAGRSHNARHPHRHTAGLTCAIAPLFLSCSHGFFLVCIVSFMFLQLCMGWAKVCKTVSCTLR